MSSFFQTFWGENDHCNYKIMIVKYLDKLKSEKEYSFSYDMTNLYS